MVTTHSLRRRLLLAVSVTTIACGSSDSASTSSVVGSGIGGSSAAGAAGSGTGGAGTGGAGTGGVDTGGGAGSGAGPTASCHATAPCHGDEWCGYATGAPMMTPCGGCGVPNDHCQCDGTALACGRSPGFLSVTVCVPGGSCLAASDPALHALLGARFGPGCPSLGAPTSEGTATTQSDGVAVCCYAVPTLGCAGRPLFIGDALRTAPLGSRDDWG